VRSTSWSGIRQCQICGSDTLTQELVYGPAIFVQVSQEDRGLPREVENNRCAMQYHEYLHMRAVGLVVYHATISVRCPMRMLCMYSKRLHASRITMILIHYCWKEDLPSKSGKLPNML
jgi:hypothetical protein